MPRPPVKKKTTAPRRTSLRGSAVSSTKRNSTVAPSASAVAAPPSRKQTTTKTSSTTHSASSKPNPARRSTRSSINTNTPSSTRKATGKAKPDAIAAAVTASKLNRASRKRTSTDANSSNQNEEPIQKSAKRRRVVEEEEDAVDEAPAPRTAPPIKKIKKKPARTSNSQVVIHSKRNNDVPTSSEKSRWDVEEDSADDEYQIPGLKPRVRKISAATVEAKWGGLSDNIQGDILNMLQGIAKQVLTAFRSDKQRAEAQVVLTQLSQKFERRLQRYIAPPGKDYSFNLEKIMDENNKLESLLEPYNKQIVELEASLGREATGYEKDIERLDDLRKNAESEASLRSRQQQSLHSCLKYGPKKDVVQLERSTASLRLAETSNKKEMNAEFTLAEDDKLFTTVKRLQNHLLSMQQNSKVLGGIPDQLQKTRAYVDDILYQKNMHEKILGVSL